MRVEEFTAYSRQSKKGREGHVCPHCGQTKNRRRRAYLANLPKDYYRRPSKTFLFVKHECLHCGGKWGTFSGVLRRLPHYKFHNVSVLLKQTNCNCFAYRNSHGKLVIWFFGEKYVAEDPQKPRRKIPESPGQMKAITRLQIKEAGYACPYSGCDGKEKQQTIKAGTGFLTVATCQKCGRAYLVVDERFSDPEILTFLTPPNSYMGFQYEAEGGKSLFFQKKTGELFIME